MPDEKNDLGSHNSPYDALLLVSFGGPEGLDDVLPFLENVVRGKNVPRQRLLEVAARYELFDGVSPLNSENRALLMALVDELNAHGPAIPVYWGNRNWHPMLAEAVAEMADDGVRRALAFVTSPFGSYSGCRQYAEDIEAARREVGDDAPPIDKLRLFYNHPGLIESIADRVAEAIGRLPEERQSGVRLIFSAHSIPTESARTSPYQHQLTETARLVVEWLHERQKIGSASGALPWDLVYQSRSGRPSQSWLEPDISGYLRRTAKADQDVVIVPLGFLAENMEVVYDLDVEVQSLCDELGVNMARAEVVGTHPRFVRMIRELVVERFDPAASRLWLGTDGPWPDSCPAGCCQANAVPADRPA